MVVGIGVGLEQFLECVCAFSPTGFQELPGRRSEQMIEGSEWSLTLVPSVSSSVDIV